jgi:hypothetical protein
MMMTRWNVSGRNMAKESKEKNMSNSTENNSPVGRRRGGIRKHKTRPKKEKKKRM